MFTKGLSKQTQSNLESLSNVQFVSKYYLAGGTGLSLHLGHRFSHDLDFFSLTPEKSIIIASGLMNKGMLEVLQNDEGTFNGRLNGVKMSFFLYPYKLLFPVVIYRNVKIADILDIACMKIEAISSRGTKRDFVDLYTICNTTKSLQELLTLFEEKYEGIKYNMLHILKSLVYFEDAEHDEMPRMITNISWNEVKEFFQIEAKKIIFPVG